MDRDTTRSHWQDLSVTIKRRWDKLSDAEIARAEGDREYLVSKVHERYGLARDEIDEELLSLGVGSEDAMVGPRIGSAMHNRDRGRATPPDESRHTGRERRRGGERRS